MNQTEDIEASIGTVLDGGPLKLAEVLDRFAYVGDPRWIAVALMHLRQRGEIRWVGCDADHNHDGDCVVALP